MILLAVVPFRALLVLDADLERDFNFEFEARGCTVSVRFSQIPLADGTTALDAIVLAIRNVPTPIADAIRRRNELKDVGRIVVAIANRVLRSLRTFGMVPHVEELSLDWDANAIFRYLRVEYSEDGDGREYLVGSASDYNQSWFDRIPRWPFNSSLSVKRLEDVVEAIQDNVRECPPEYEFFVNASEHLDRGSLRLAVVEAVVSLEIALSAFLQVRLKSEGGARQQGIAAMLGPEVGLTARVGALLSLTMPAHKMTDIDIDIVLSMINWRNRIAHRTGRLPENVREVDVRGGVSQVLRLTRQLSLEKRRLELQPEADAIAKALMSEFSVRVELELSSEHRVSVVFDLGPRSFDDQGRGIVTLATIRLVIALKERDKRFEPHRHLFVVVVSRGERVWAGSPFSGIQPLP